MASERQIRANRKNAKRSTGPRTLAGRMKSSQLSWICRGSEAFAAE